MTISTKRLSAPLWGVCVCVCVCGGGGGEGGGKYKAYFYPRVFSGVSKGSVGNKVVTGG